jgi:hypothetical protein
MLLVRWATQRQRLAYILTFSEDGLMERRSRVQTVRQRVHLPRRPDGERGGTHDAAITARLGRIKGRFCSTVPAPLGLVYLAINKHRKAQTIDKASRERERRRSA